MKQFDKQDVATELLDAAITEHLDHARHFAAYNAAAVSEELTSKLLALQGDRRHVRAAKPALTALAVGALLAPDDAVVLGPDVDSWLATLAPVGPSSSQSPDYDVPV